MNGLPTPPPDPLAYLNRIRMPLVEGGDLFPSLEPSPQVLQMLHQAHLLAVPFENLSIHYGEPIALREDLLYEKIVLRNRGGFCYELNGLFAWLLDQLGFSVALLSASVAEAGGDYSPEFDHLSLLVHRLDGSDWIADVGFGDSFRLPLRLVADMVQDGGDGYHYRLHIDDHQGRPPQQPPYHSHWILQRSSDDSSWEPQYRFTLKPHQLSDFSERCKYQQTSPESHFTQRRICSLAILDGRITLADRRLIVTTFTGKREERLVESEEEYRQILAERFGVLIPPPA